MVWIWFSGDSTYSQMSFIIIIIIIIIIFVYEWIICLLR